MSDTAVDRPDLVDSHCHLDRLNLDAYDGDFDAMMAATRADGISHMLCIGVDLETFPRVRELAERHADVHATVGVHPLYKDSREPDADELVRLADHPRVVAIGITLTWFSVGNIVFMTDPGQLVVVLQRLVLGPFG